jgi:hypothetical protein
MGEVRPKTPEPMIRMECGGEGSGDIISEGGEWRERGKGGYMIFGVGLSHAELPTNTGKNQAPISAAFSDVEKLSRSVSCGPGSHG